MADRQEDFFTGDDLEAIFAAIDQEMIDGLRTTDKSSTSTTKDPPDTNDSSAPVAQYRCELCEKVCLTKRGLTRHTNSKHSDKNDASVTSAAQNQSKSAEEILHPLYFKKMVEESVNKISNDHCFPDELLNPLKEYNTGNLDKINHTYGFIKELIVSYDGGEKFYPAFYKIVSDTEDFFPGMDKNNSLLVGFELANHVLKYLKKSTIPGGNTNDNESLVFSDKERSIISYLGGYVFGTMYRKVRFSPEKSDYQEQCLAFLLAGKCSDADNLPEHKLVTSRDRKGLWKVSSIVTDIFVIAERTFRAYTSKVYNKIDSKEMLNTLLQDKFVNSSVTKLRDLSTMAIKKELALNILEDLLMKYIRTRTFSFVKDKVQAHKMKNNQIRSQALRTELKQGSSSLDQGH